MIYVATWGPYVKIGYSSDPARRVEQIGKTGDKTTLPPTVPVGSPTLIGSVPGDLGTEAMLHAVLDEDRIAGEWFRRSPAIERLCRWLENRAYHFPPPLFTDPAAF